MTFKEWRNLDLNHIEQTSTYRIFDDWNSSISRYFPNIKLDKNLAIFLATILENKLELLNNFELLYEVENIDDDNDLINIFQFKNIIRCSFYKLYGEIKNIIAYGDKNLEDFQVEIYGDNALGYAGYDLDNQDGDYSKTRNTQKTNDKLRYLSFINKRAIFYGDFIINEIKRTLLRGIY